MPPWGKIGKRWKSWYNYRGMKTFNAKKIWGIVVTIFLVVLFMNLISVLVINPGYASLILPIIICSVILLALTIFLFRKR